MSEIHGATGSYVLNALDASELDEFEAHLAVCPTCSREVVEFCETAAELSLLATAPPPAALKSSIMSAIGGVRVLPPLDAPLPMTPMSPASPPRYDDLPTPRRAVEPVAAAPLPVDELSLRRAQRRSRLLSLAVAAAMVAALAMGGWVVALKQQQQGQIASATLETQLLSAPDAKTYSVELASGARASFVASKGLNRAMFASSALPDPGQNRAWQLWTLAGDLDAPVITPDKTLGGGSAIRLFLDGNVSGSAALAISNEPEGGSPQPTTPPVLVKL